MYHNTLFSARGHRQIILNNIFVRIYNVQLQIVFSFVDIIYVLILRPSNLYRNIQVDYFWK